MTTPLVFFILSGFVMIYLILHKHMELVYGRGLIVKSILHRGDHVSHTWLGKFRHWFSHVTRRNIVIAINHSIVVFLRACIFVSSYIRNSMARALEKLSRREEVLKKNGAASAYLKHITEAKNNTNHHTKIE